ncbi:D-serine deaminase (plasmid) [Sinorhizobium americanum CCGM7]|uniref:alanine racemase n=1 Tax=Sinorhizobium americanum TaxID=194963 RepID=UPI0004D81E7A|nr:alanine racemase [Sinorhizobium americanum]APG86953.1 D-serine deaminase [Sinorhizobium americanum CCGM7]
MDLQADVTAYNATVLAAWLDRSNAEKLNGLFKGLPSFFDGTFEDLPSEGLVLGDPRLPLPLAVLRERAMIHNRRWMSEYIRASGVNLAPHGKTSMAPALFRSQLEDGVWGLTAATAHQLAFFAELGIRRVILANQLVGDGNISIALDCAAKYPDLDFYVLADSQANIDQLAAAVDRRTNVRPLKVLIEIGAEGGRTGFRLLADALNLARSIHATRSLSLAGVEGYEGIVPGSSQASRETGVRTMIDQICEFASICDAGGFWDEPEILLTAGGTEFFDICSRGLLTFSGSIPHRVVIRSGCYITSDSIAYKRAFERICERDPEARSLELKPPEGALEVWAAIQSRPEPGLAFATMGKRDISHDWDLPVPVRWMRPGEMPLPAELSEGHRVARLNDQHAYLEIPTSSPLRIGDLVGFGVSHACTTFDKWRAILTVDDAYRVTGSVRTFF